MSDEVVKIEVDGRELEARKGVMLIEATDAAGIYIPRFCYHKHLSVAANCRMCLVEVERAPKPMPACATPVMDGMKVYTRSPKAAAAQHATMEFLLINHPLDCPICDQGGECELQDLAMGYGGDISQFTERKRVVRDKDIGPLVQTDMTRCIHCTRCVRFGEEIAGLRELGATGRGEHMEIGTYVAKAMTSELSGNVIDLCPVGALTNKPYRYSARAWELQQRDGIAPHDGLGSNLHFHVKGRVVKRVIPAENAAVNETWLSDRDRYSYLGMNQETRLERPRIKRDGRWSDCDWETAFDVVTQELGTIAHDDAGALAALASPSSTTEELYLLQRLVRGLGSSSIDHRLRQVDFSGQADEPPYPGLPPLADIEGADAVVLIGAYPRHEQPLVNLRLRKAALKGAAVVALDAIERAFNYPLAGQHACMPSALPGVLAGLLIEVASLKGATVASELTALVDEAACAAIPELKAHAARLAKSRSAIVLTGALAEQHPRRSVLMRLGAELARILGGQTGCMASGANAAGAWLAGAVPHRGAAGKAIELPGYDLGGLLETSQRGYVLLGFDPALDCAESRRLQGQLEKAEFVVALSAFESAALDAAADVILPIAVFGENEGSFVNVNGLWQSFAPAVPPRGEARPAWKALRMLGVGLQLEGFDAVEVGDVSREVKALAGAVGPEARGTAAALTASPAGQSMQLEVIVDVPMYRVDQLVRHAPALQQMPQSGDDRVRIAASTAAQLGLVEGTEVELVGANARAMAELAIDDRVPPGSCLIDGARAALAELAVPGTVLDVLRASGNAAA
ncbi:MAG: NADH-quinone oxidoreductase subunit NuoG [Gammaproteobacteria bacterium]